MKDIKGYEGKYAITKDGRVWSHPKKWTTGVLGNVRHSHHGRWRGASKSGTGYLVVNLCKEGKIKHKNVHRLVAETFIGNPKKWPQVNHKNGVKTDNRVENLEWCTGKYNVAHAYKTGINPSGESHYKAKLRNQDVFRIRQKLKEGESQTRIAKTFGVSKYTISLIKVGKTWKHI